VLTSIDRRDRLIVTAKIQQQPLGAVLGDFTDAMLTPAVLLTLAACENALLEMRILTSYFSNGIDKFLYRVVSNVNLSNVEESWSALELLVRMLTGASICMS
jgi:hypothetical protein